MNVQILPSPIHERLRTQNTLRLSRRFCSRDIAIKKLHFLGSKEGIFKTARLSDGAMSATGVVILQASEVETSILQVDQYSIL